MDELNRELVLVQLGLIADFCKITGQLSTSAVLEFIRAALKLGGEPELALLCRTFEDDLGKYLDTLAEDCPDILQLVRPQLYIVK